MNNISKLRKGLGMNQSQFAKALHVTQGAVSQWENGITNPDMSLVLEIAALCGTSTDEVLGNKNSPTNNSKTNTNRELEELMRLPGMKILFDSAKNASEDDRIKAAHIIEVLKSGNKSD